MLREASQLHVRSPVYQGISLCVRDVLIDSLAKGGLTAACEVSCLSRHLSVHERCLDGILC